MHQQKHDLAKQYSGVITVRYCGGSSMEVVPRITSLFSFVVSLWQTRSWKYQNNNIRWDKNCSIPDMVAEVLSHFTSDRVAPPIIKTKILFPIFLKSEVTFFNVESLRKIGKALSSGLKLYPFESRFHFH
jgi:hypothetical protein